MRKQIICIFLVLAAAFSLFPMGASEEGAADSGKNTELLLWLPPFGSGDSLDQEFWTEAIKSWAEANNVKVNIEITPWGGYEEKYLTGFASGDGPDIGYMYLEMFNDFIEMNTLADIDSFFTEEEKANYIYWNQGNMKGAQYALPFIVGNARIPYFNMDLLAQAGVTELPTTWEELVQTATKIKEADLENVIPFAQEWADPAIGALNNLYYPYLWQAGGSIYNEDGTKVALMDNDAGVEAAQFLYDLKFKSKVLSDVCLAMDGASVRQEFMAGKIAIASMDANSGAKLTEAGINWDFIPSFENKEKAVWVASDSLIMSNTSENKEAAASLMKFITSAAVMSEYHTQITTFPPITYDEDYNDNPVFKDMYENGSADFHTLPVADGSFKVMDIFHDYACSHYSRVMLSPSRV